MTDGAQIEYYIWDRKLADTLSSLLELTPPQRDLCFFCGGRR